MPSTNAELPDIIRTLNGVQTTGQARVAIGKALEALSVGFEVAEKIPTTLGVPVEREKRKGALNMRRLHLEAWYDKIPGVSLNDDYRQDWAANRWKVEGAYIEIAGVEGAANYVPRTSNWEILATSLKEAPGIFGETVGDILNKAAETAGKVGAGLAKGLGGWGWGAIIVVVIVVVLVMGGRQAVLNKVVGA